MKHFLPRLAMLSTAAAVAVLAGCASAPPGARLTYETSPAGATIWEGGKPLGVAPVMQRYDGDASGAQIRTPEVTAIWPSGAKTTFWTYLKTGDDNVTTLVRPANAPNLQVDLDKAQQFKSAEERQKAALMRDQARNSARCQAQMQGGASAGVDDCK